MSSARKKAKRTRLPKEFEQLLASRDLAVIKTVFDTCDVNARGGYGKGTALMLDPCPAELARWLVTQGADLAAVDQFGYTALHAQARNRGGCVSVLIELGADVNANTASSGTPLHAAVDAKNAAHVATLLAHGAEVNAANRQGLTPLEYGLQRCSNIDLEPMARVARILLDAGATRSDASQKLIRQLGATFEFHRANFAKEYVKEASEALTALYALFDVAPLPQRRIHDGKEPITVGASTWEEQFDELWNLLVPSQGPAATVQGEVIRIAGRIGNEINGNGGLNWDRDFAMMAKAFCEHLRTGVPLSAGELDQCETLVRSLTKPRDAVVQKLAELAVAWVLANPKPMALTKPGYSR